MTKVALVTDSTADIPSEIAKELGITIVPNQVIFGEIGLRDGVDITPQELYERLKNGARPTTAAAAPEEFAKVYRELAGQNCGIISIHTSEKESAIFSSALIGADIVRREKGCEIEVINSATTGMALGLLVMSAARLARDLVQDKEAFEKTINAVNANIPNVRILAVLETLEYAKRGGRLKKDIILRIARPTASVIGKISLRTIITLNREGNIALVGITKTSKKQERLIELAKDGNFSPVVEMAVEYTNNLEEANELKRKLHDAFPGIEIHLCQAGAALVTHGGPGAIAISLIRT